MNSNILLNIDEVNKSLAEEKHTLPIMTKFEKTQLLAIRTTELASGSTPFIETDKITAEDIAYDELIDKKLPYIIKRTFPDGTFELWNINELIIKE